MAIGSHFGAASDPVAIATADATDLASCFTLLNAIRGWCSTHFASVTAHNEADATFASWLPLADMTGSPDLGTCRTFAASLVSAVEQHFGRGEPVHLYRDAASLPVTLAFDPSRQTGSLAHVMALANLLKAKVNTHGGKLLPASMR